MARLTDQEKALLEYKAMREQEQARQADKAVNSLLQKQLLTQAHVNKS